MGTFTAGAQVLPSKVAGKHPARSAKADAIVARSLVLAKTNRRKYDARARRLAPDDVVSHFALAQWCTRNGLPHCARWELHVVLRQVPDHAGARSMRGQVFHAGRWQPRAEAMRAKGLVQIERDRWVRKYDAARERHERNRMVAIQHEANLLFTRLAARDPRIRTDARRKLEALAVRSKLPELRRLARREAIGYERFWRTRHSLATTHTGLLTIAATHSTLESMDTVTTTLGAGTPIRLQLPRVRTISIRTTIAAPLGFGH